MVAERKSVGYGLSHVSLCEPIRMCGALHKLSKMGCRCTTTCQAAHQSLAPRATCTNLFPDCQSTYCRLSKGVWRSDSVPFSLTPRTILKVVVSMDSRSASLHSPTLLVSFCSRASSHTGHCTSAPAEDLYTSLVSAFIPAAAPPMRPYSLFELIRS